MSKAQKKKVEWKQALQKFTMVQRSEKSVPNSMDSFIFSNMFGEIEIERDQK
jgi:hypothetical protein